MMRNALLIVVLFVGVTLGRRLVVVREPVEAEMVPVYRFWSPVLSSHFYTIKESEKQNLLDNYPHVWTYEGPVFNVHPIDSNELGNAIQQEPNIEVSP